MASDDRLWKVFSTYIRLRDASDDGTCKCFTCGFTADWKRFDAGHGIGRQHKATKFHEQNVWAQCKRCNGFEGGKREVFKEEVNRRCGPQTWEKLEVMSRMTCKRDQFEVDVMTKYYSDKVKELRKLKHL